MLSDFWRECCDEYGVYYFDDFMEWLRERALMDPFSLFSDIHWHIGYICEHLDELVEDCRSVLRARMHPMLLRQFSSQVMWSGKFPWQ